MVVELVTGGGEPQFEGFPKMPRFNREVVITEKIDGTNGQIYIGEDGAVRAGSRNRWVTPGKATDNLGFAAWVEEHADALREALGPGRHFGEWFGQGIARNYGLKERRFALFNTSRWYDPKRLPEMVPEEIPHLIEVRTPVPDFLTVVPTLWITDGQNVSRVVAYLVDILPQTGSVAVPGFMSPEGIVVSHTAGNHLYKVLLENDELPKSLAEKRAV